MLSIRYNESGMTDKKAWHKFINDAYIEFRGDTRRTISDFAEWLDLPQAQLSQYMKLGGKVPRSQTVITKFVTKYGSIIYDVLEFPRPDDSLDSLPEPLRSISKEVKETLAEYKVAGDSPEAEKLVDEIMKKYGYNSNSTES
jgi:hypothetical protein